MSVEPARSFLISFFNLADAKTSQAGLVMSTRASIIIIAIIVKEYKWRVRLGYKWPRERETGRGDRERDKERQGHKQRQLAYTVNFANNDIRRGIRKVSLFAKCPYNRSPI